MNINLCERIVLHFLNWACGHIVNFESCLILNIHLCWSLSEYIHFIFMRNIFLEKEFIVCCTGFLGEFEKQTKYKINKKRENFKNCSRTHFFFKKISISNTLFSLNIYSVLAMRLFLDDQFITINVN